MKYSSYSSPSIPIASSASVNSSSVYGSSTHLYVNSPSLYFPRLVSAILILLILSSPYSFYCASYPLNLCHKSKHTAYLYAYEYDNTREHIKALYTPYLLLNQYYLKSTALLSVYFPVQVGTFPLVPCQSLLRLANHLNTRFYRVLHARLLLGSLQALDSSKYYIRSSSRCIGCRPPLPTRYVLP